MAIFKTIDCEIIEDFQGKQGSIGEIATISVKHNPTGIQEIDSVDVDGTQADSQANALKVSVIDNVKTQVEALP